MKKIWVRVLFVLFAIFSLALTTYAWFVPDEESNGFDGYTEGITFDFEINDNLNITEEFKVSNIVFFDIAASNNKSEVDYLLDCAVMVELNLINTSKHKIEVSISQVIEAIDVPHVRLFFSDAPITSLDTTVFTSCQDVINNYQNVNITIDSSSATDLKAGKVYMYVIGVQPDSSSNNDFLNVPNGTYKFKVNMSAEGIN